MLVFAAINLVNAALCFLYFVVVVALVVLEPVQCLVWLLLFHCRCCARQWRRYILPKLAVVVVSIYY